LTAAIKAKPGDVILYSDCVMCIVALEPSAEFANDGKAKGKLLNGGYYARQITFVEMAQRLKKGHQLIERRNGNG